MEKLFNKDSIGVHECIIAISEKGSGFLIKSEPSLFDCEVFDGCLLDDNMNDENIPKEIGIYKCKIKVRSFQCNHPEDPVEYDMHIWIEDAEKINVEW